MCDWRGVGRGDEASFGPMLRTLGEARARSGGRLDVRRGALLHPAAVGGGSGKRAAADTRPGGRNLPLVYHGELYNTSNCAGTRRLGHAFTIHSNRGAVNAYASGGGLRGRYNASSLGVYEQRSGPAFLAPTASASSRFFMRGRAGLSFRLGDQDVPGLSGMEAVLSAEACAR
jgi:hypothetical protein